MHGSQDDGEPRLIMGKNQLVGEEVKLKKPLVVTELSRADNDGREYRVVGVVREKVVFQNRPVPVSRPQLPVVPETLASKRQRVAAAVEQPNPIPA